MGLLTGKLISLVGQGPGSAACIKQHLVLADQGSFVPNGPSLLPGWQQKSVHRRAQPGPRVCAPCCPFSGLVLTLALGTDPPSPCRLTGAP